MKHPLILVSTAVATLAFSFNNLSYSTDGRIYFTGEIVEASCLVKNEIQVAMQSASAEVFKKTGDTGKITPFTIELSQCPDVAQSASISFRATPSIQNSELIQTSGTAEGVAIELIDTSNQQRLAFRNGESRTSTPTKLKTNTVNTFNFGARYVSTVPIVKAGNAKAFADFIVTYD